MTDRISLDGLTRLAVAYGDGFPPPIGARQEQSAYSQSPIGHIGTI